MSQLQSNHHVLDHQSHHLFHRIKLHLLCYPNFQTRSLLKPRQRCKAPPITSTPPPHPTPLANLHAAFHPTIPNSARYPQSSYDTPCQIQLCSSVPVGLLV